jgi:hypothetical protein
MVRMRVGNGDARDIPSNSMNYLSAGHFDVHRARFVRANLARGCA